jgi:uncharacterized protein (TIGR02118 family)
MIKVTMLMKRLPHLTFDEFDAYWRDHHGPLVSSFAEVLRIKRYVQTPAVQDPDIQERARASRNMAEAFFDGTAELWWDSFEDLAARKSEESAKALRALVEDERKFIDLARSQLWYGTPREFIRG